MSGLVCLDDGSVEMVVWMVCLMIEVSVKSQDSEEKKKKGEREKEDCLFFF
jgi:hypothetical protein